MRGGSAIVALGRLVVVSGSPDASDASDSSVCATGRSEVFAAADDEGVGATLADPGPHAATVHSPNATAIKPVNR
ncbi:hypothetical protein BJP25_04120 [Actinokineospora bangkokensis]|uniref:Uncharacterized protein n=1 Tax=Actinokineospora bangkokensis TaxID=1193682 RepID=A0A1Q9LDQ0_9PSEU|nr:hypothetical protein BJP25_04120 [Actinokineospora bangkokensis]